MRSWTTDAFADRRFAWKYLGHSHSDGDSPEKLASYFSFVFEVVLP
jgi:hypothetical protein